MTMNATPTPPDPPAITNLTSGSGQVSVAFVPTDGGTAPITSYTVNTETTQGQQIAATGPSSPITVFGLTNGQTYDFWMTATNAFGTSRESDGAGPIAAGATPPKILDGPVASGVVGQLYDSQFTVSGTPTPTVTLVTKPGAIYPENLVLQRSGELKGFPRAAGTYQMTVQATNPYGSDQASVQIVFSDPTTTVSPRPETGRKRVSANICTKGAKDRPECARRLLYGTFPRLKDHAAVSLVRGPVTYATGHVTRDGRLSLRGRCGPPSERQCEQPDAGRYTLVLRRKHRSTFVPVTGH
jgi:hypothetical protein